MDNGIRNGRHYFIGDKRIASRIGSGSFNNVYGQNGSFLTAGQQDYAERLNQIETQREDYYRELGIAPGIPTMKGSYGDPENTGVGYNTIIKELGDHTVPAEWAQYVKHNEVEGSSPGAPIQWDDPSDPESTQPGYGFVADNSGEPEETFYYHSDHLGSTSYITDKEGYVTQYDAYLPYGDLLVDEHSSSEDLPYRFNGKELDEETGLYYYGARYMQPIASIWYGVDLLAEKYPNVSGYVYCIGNPIKLLDTNGKDWIRHNHTYMYSPTVNSQEDVNKIYGDGWEYLFQSGKIFSTHGTYSYDLTREGDVKDSYTGEIILGEFKTPGGSTLINSNQYFLQHELSFMEKWAQSDNFFVATAYGTLNDMYVGLQVASCGLLQREEWRNPFTGTCFGNLDGSPNYTPTDALPGIATTIFPTGTTIKGLTPLKKLNAADFSHLFKGTLSRLKPKTRGGINKLLNRGIEKINGMIGTGEILRNAINATKTTVDIQERKRKND